MDDFDYCYNYNSETYCLHATINFINKNGFYSHHSHLLGGGEG